MEEKFIDLGVAYINKNSVSGIAVVDVPANPTCKEYFVIYIYIMGQNQPIAIPFATKEERDAAYVDLKGRL